MNKDTRDSLSILKQAEIIHSRAKEIEKEYRTISKLKAFQIATDEVLGGSNWNY